MQNLDADSLGTIQILAGDIGTGFCSEGIASFLYRRVFVHNLDTIVQILSIVQLLAGAIETDFCSKGIALFQYRRMFVQNLDAYSLCNTDSHQRHRN